MDGSIHFSKVSKRFRMGNTHDSLRDLISHGLGRLLGKRARQTPPATFWALRDVDFTVGHGEAVGIIGPNGAGKSTALKLLAGILRPEEGEISVSGRLAALIEVGAGFHGDLTGRENIFLNGAILGMNREEIRRKLEAIVAFAGIERFIDMPVKRYSSGMYARLGFSIAAHVDPDVLLVDEVLSVGDAVFRLRCLERMRDLLRAGTTLIFVTHNLDQMQSVCPRSLVLDKGRSVFDGPSREAVTHYLQAMSRAYVDRPVDVVADGAEGASAVELKTLRFLDESGEEVVWAKSHQRLRAEVTLKLHRPFRKLVVELNMCASIGDNLLSFNSGRSGLMFDADAGEHQARLEMVGLPVSAGHYFWNVRVWDGATGESQLDTPFAFPMVIDDQGQATGRLAVDHQWTFVAQTPVASGPADPAIPNSSPGGTENDHEGILLC